LWLFPPARHIGDVGGERREIDAEAEAEGGADRIDEVETFGVRDIAADQPKHGWDRHRGSIALRGGAG